MTDRSLGINLPPIKITPLVDIDYIITDLQLIQKELLKQRDNKGKKLHYENRYFIFNEYCDCDTLHCNLCNLCRCNDFIFEYQNKSFTSENYWQIPFRERSKHYTLLKAEPDFCLYCQGELPIPPSFYHKPTSSEIHWYKNIEDIYQINLQAEWHQIVKTTLASIR